MSTLFKIIHFLTEEHHWSGHTFWLLVLMTDNPLRWDEADRCGVRSNLSPHLNTRGIKYQKMATKWHQQPVLSYVTQETWEDHTDALSIFLQYIRAEWVWAGCWQGRNNVSLHLYSVWRTERGAERGCLAVGRAFPVSSIQTCQVHSNIDSAHQFKLSEHFQKVIEPLTSSHHQSCWWCESKTLHRWVCQVCVNIPHFVLHQNFFSSAPTWCRAAAYIIIPPCTAQSAPVLGWGKMSRGHIFSSRLSNSFGILKSWHELDELWYQSVITVVKSIIGPTWEFK